MRISNLRSGKPSGNPLTILHLQFTIDKYTASMVPLRVLSRTNLARSSLSTSFTSSISFTSFRLRTLFLSLRSFLDSRPLFSITSALFLQNTRGGIPLRELVRCAEAQKCLFVTPLFATLTHSMSRKSFPCHSYANTRDTRATAPRFFSPLATRHSPLPPDGFSISFRINTCKSVSKQTTLTPFRINTYEKHGEGEGGRCRRCLCGTFRLLVQCWQFPGGTGAFSEPWYMARVLKQR